MDNVDVGEMKRYIMNALKRRADLYAQLSVMYRSDAANQNWLSAENVVSKINHAKAAISCESALKDALEEFTLAFNGRADE